MMLEVRVEVVNTLMSVKGIAVKVKASCPQKECSIFVEPKEFGSRR